MHYTTVTVGLVVGHEIQVGASEIEQAIAEGLKTLSEEIGGPVELVNVIPVPTHQGLCLVVMAKPYQPITAIAKPFMSGVMPL